MDNKTCPPTRPFGTLLLASINGIPRIAVVVTAGFFYSPVFSWERRFHKHYPEDTINGHKKRYANLIRGLKSHCRSNRELLPTSLPETTATGATIPANMNNKASP
jgi:hypothetical protein